MTRPATTGGPQGRGVLGRAYDNFGFEAGCAGGNKVRNTQVVRVKNKQPLQVDAIGGVGHRNLSNVLLCGIGGTNCMIIAPRASEQSGGQLRRGGFGRCDDGDVQ